MKILLQRRALVLWVFFGSRTALVIVAVFAISFFPVLQDEIGVPVPVSEGQRRTSNVLEVLTAWDAAHFIDVAQDGYRTANDQELEEFVRFPVWPGLLKLSATVLPFVGIQVLSILLSLGFLLAAALWLRGLVVAENGSEQAGDRAAIYLLIFPAAYIFSMGYSESLFIFLTVVFLASIRRERFLTATLAGLLAALTRAPGFLLAAVAVIELFRRFREAGPHDGDSAKSKAVLIGGYFAAAAAPLVGLAAWLGYTWFRTGDPLLILGIANKPFFRSGNSFFLWEAASRLLGLSAHRSPADFYYAFVILGGFVGLLLAARKIPPSFLLYGVLAITFMCSGKLLTATDRYIMATVPVIWGLAELGSRRWFDALYRTAAPSLMAMMAVLAWSGRWTP